MEVSAIKHMGAAGAHGRSPLLRLQSDERLVTLVRRGNQHAFEALVSRYQSRLLAFCRHMLSSREDAEDVLQEVFTAAFNAMLADERPINVRPWLYRIARNRSLNHLRRVQAIGVDSMDTHFSEGGISTAEKVHRREDFRLLIADVQELPETQKTALLLREIDALSYEQIAEAMDNTVPSVKSLLVRARIGLAEAAEARLLDCNVVRLDLGEVAEGLKRISPPVRRHLRTCTDCASFRKQLVNTNRALAALMPVGPLLLFKKMLLAQIGTTAAASGGSAAAGTTFGGALQLGVNATAGKAAAGLAAAAIVTAGAVEVKHVTVERVGTASVVVTASGPPATSQPAAPPATSISARRTTPAAPQIGIDGVIGVPPSAADGEPAPVADEAEARRARAEAADALPPESAAKPEEADDAVTPVLTTGRLPAPAGGDPALLGAPAPLPPVAPPMHTEVIVLPGGAAMGTPATGVVMPGSVPPVPVTSPLHPMPIPTPTITDAVAPPQPAPAPSEPLTGTSGGGPQPVVESEPTPETAPEAEPEPEPTPQLEPEAQSTPDPEPQPTPEPQPAGAPQPAAEPQPEPDPVVPQAELANPPAAPVEPAPAEPAPAPADPAA